MILPQLTCYALYRHYTVYDRPDSGSRYTLYVYDEYTVLSSDRWSEESVSALLKSQVYFQLHKINAYQRRYFVLIRNIMTVIGSSYSRWYFKQGPMVDICEHKYMKGDAIVSA